MALVALVDDFTTSVFLDKELTDRPKSKVYLNSGVHPSITIENLLAFLPYPNFTFSAWSDTETYHDYNKAFNRAWIVTYQGKLYQSIQNSNVANTPSSSPEYWMETSSESLKLKMFIRTIIDRVKSDLLLEKRLINNQFIYENTYIKDQNVNLGYQYAGWTFEAKGSDYIEITINQMSLKELVPSDTDIFVLHNGILVDTISLQSERTLEFKDVDFSFSGSGKWQFVYECKEVLTNRGYIEPLQYDGFVCYTCYTQSEDLNNADWIFSTMGNGLGFNVTASLNSDVYVSNNFSALGGLIRATFELMTLEMFLSNSHNRSNRQKEIQLDKDALIAETKSLDMNTVAKRYQTQLNIARKAMQKTFDTHLFNDDADTFIEFSSL